MSPIEKKAAGSGRWKATSRGVVRSLLSVCYGGVLLLAIISYGANTAITLTLASSAAFLVLFFSFIFIGEPESTSRPLWVAFLALCTVSLWSWLQTIEWPTHFGADPAWMNVATFPFYAGSSISVTPGDAMLGLLKLGLPIAIFMTSLILFNSDNRAVAAFKVLAVSGGCLAILSLAQFLIVPEALLIDTKQFYRDSLTGPFVNRNTAGTLFGVVSVMLFALTVHSARKIDLYSLSRVLDRGGRIVQPREILMATLFCLLFLASISALFLTNSRAATGSAFVAVLLLSLLIALGPKNRGSRKNVRSLRRRALRRMSFAILLIAVPALVFSMFSGRVQLRAAENGADDPRFCAAASIWTATVDHWLLGAGLTSFELVFPAYRDPSCGVLGKWDKAHNFYVEGLFSLGLLFPIVIIAVLTSLGKALSNGLRLRKSRRYIVAAGMSSTLLVAAHAFFDFSLQIPGFAVFFAAVLGPVVTVSLSRIE